MKNLILALLTAFLLAGCKTTYVPIETTTTVTETVRDTIVQVQVETETVTQVVRDTTSTVETRYARSTATWHDGTLEHMIENKTDSIPVNVRYIDREKIVEKPVPYPVEKPVYIDKPVRMPLRWYEVVLQGIGIAALGALVLRIALFVKKRKT